MIEKRNLHQAKLAINKVVTRAQSLKNLKTVQLIVSRMYKYFDFDADTYDKLCTFLDGLTRKYQFFSFKIESKN